MAKKGNKQQRLRKQLQRERKQMRRFVSPSTKQLRRERASAARLEYKPVIKAARDEIRISREAQRQLNEFYGGYRAATNRAAERSQQNTDDLYGRAQNTAADLGRRYDDRIREMSAEDAKSAEIRGATQDTSAERRSVAGESQRQNLMNADAQLLARLGASSSEYLRNVALASNAGQRLDLRRERNIRRNARNDIRDAKKERNAKMNVLRSEQRGAERDWRLSQQTLAKDYGYQDTVRDQTAGGIREAQLYSSASRRQARAKERAARINANAYGGGGKKVKGSDISEGMSILRNQLRQGQKSIGWVIRNKQQVIDTLVDRGNMDRRLARIVVNRLISRRGKSAVRNATAPWYG